MLTQLYASVSLRESIVVKNVAHRRIVLNSSKDPKGNIVLHGELLSKGLGTKVQTFVVPQ
jgi:hypothetical protein